jgi:hypothetical protein
MGKHNPHAPTFIQTMNRFEKTLERFLESADFKEALIDDACHSCAWCYTHQTLRVRLLPGGVWEVPTAHVWSKGKDCLVILSQVGSHGAAMQKIGEQRDFEEILNADPAEARQVIERLYAHQEQAIKQEIRRRFQSMKQDGRMD